jgi:16S rRNA (guanine527-N7)-methyltransferase
LARYEALLVKWNRAINLVGAATLADPWRRHFLDSAQLLPHLPPPGAPGERILLDLGSGAGFPGLVLAILGAGEVHLVESDRRKARFLSTVARETGAAVTLHVERIEALAPFPVDCVTARALAPLPELIAYAAPFLDPALAAEAGRNPGVALFLKGRDLEGELTRARSLWHIDSDIRVSLSHPEGRVLRLRLLGRKDASDP